MDLMILLKEVISILKYYWSISFTIGGYSVTIGSAFIFVGVVILLIAFLKGIF